LLIDHHASPNVIPGSLDIIKEAMQKVGLRGVLCYEVTDRGGSRQRDLGLDENQRFIRAHQRNPGFRGLVGAHASFTLGDESLQACGDMADRNGTGVHIHVAEDMCDVDTARKRHRLGLVERLSKHSILRKRSILAHCIHLIPVEFTRLRRVPCWLVHNPRSNMNNGVGHARVDLFGHRAALGTDGFPADMFEEAKFGFFRMQEEGKRANSLSAATLRRGAGNSRIKADGKMMTNLMTGGQRLASEIFDAEFGTLAPGSVADLVVLDYTPPTPMTSGNMSWHFHFGMRSSMVDSVMVDGRWIVRDHQVVGVDVPEVYEKAAISAKKLWRRMEHLQ
jgi:cytosine/adenosine deaminase-related metal-dependent hydrolase